MFISIRVHWPVYSCNEKFGSCGMVKSANSATVQCTLQECNRSVHTMHTAGVHTVHTAGVQQFSAHNAHFRSGTITAGVILPTRDHLFLTGIRNLIIHYVKIIYYKEYTMLIKISSSSKDTQSFVFSLYYILLSPCIILLSRTPVSHLLLF